MVFFKAPIHPYLKKKHFRSFLYFPLKGILIYVWLPPTRKIRILSFFFMSRVQDKSILCAPNANRANDKITRSILSILRASFPLRYKETVIKYVRYKYDNKNSNNIIAINSNRVEHMI